MYWVTSRQSAWVINKCTFQNNYINLISRQISQIIRIVIKASTKDKNVNVGLYFWRKWLKVTFTASVQDHRHRRNVNVLVVFYVKSCTFSITHFGKILCSRWNQLRVGLFILQSAHPLVFTINQWSNRQETIQRNYNCQILKTCYT